MSRYLSASVNIKAWKTNNFNLDCPSLRYERTIQIYFWMHIQIFSKPYWEFFRVYGVLPSAKLATYCEKQIYKDIFNNTGTKIVLCGMPYFINFRSSHSNFIEITLRHECSPVNLLYISEQLFLRTLVDGCFLTFWSLWMLLIFTLVSTRYVTIYKF